MSIQSRPVPQIVTLDRLQLPQHLDGGCGCNRATGQNQLGAADDLAAVLGWLSRFKETPTTFAGYQREAERLLLWCVVQQSMPMSSLEWTHLLAYQGFLSNPQPAMNWLTKPGRRPSRTSREWRPFAGPLSPQSVNQAMYTLKSLFGWLVEVGYLANNPMAAYRRENLGLPTQVSHIFPQAYWAEIRLTIDLMPVLQNRQMAHAARARWLFSLIQMARLRVSEVCHSVMGGFCFKKCHDGYAGWCLDVRGNNGKKRLVPVTDELISELIRYRLAMRLPSLPSASDETPLLLPVVGAVKPLTTTAIHDILRSTLKATASRLRTSSAPALLRALHDESQWT